MTARDQLELIGPSGEIRFYTLDPARGVTNIGRHPDNDIVIDSPSVAPFHAVIYHWQKPYQIILMAADAKATVGGQALQPRSSRPIHNWDSVALDGYTLVLLEDVASVPAGTARAPQPVVAPPPIPAASAPPLPPLPTPTVRPETTAVASPASATMSPGLGVPQLPDHSDEVVLAQLSAREFTVDVDQPATLEVSIVNGGDIVATFVVNVEGVNPEWVSVSPPQTSLFEGERATIQVTITPPRVPSSRAGAHRIAVIVTSPEHPGRYHRASVTLNINPYFEHSISELSPRQQRISWSKRIGRVSYSIVNRGNSDAAFRIDAADDERACQFEFKLSDDSASLARQAELRLRPEESRAVAVNFTVRKRQFFGLSDHLHSFTVTTSPLQGQTAPRSALGQAQSSPLIGPWHVAVIALLLAVFIAFFFRPSIESFSADKPEVLSSEIMSGGSVALSWEASWFTHVSIDNDVGAIDKASGSVHVAPLESTTYRLTASTRFLEYIYRDWFTATREITVIVDPEDPIVRFSADKTQLTTGQTATLSWQVLNADEIVLTTNGAPETLPLAQSIGTRVVTPEGEVTFTLRARNRVTKKDIIRTVILNAVTPPPTPLPPPIIQRFDVLPSPIIAGEEITLEWSVTGVDSVTIEPLGSFPPSGRLIEKPDTTTSYRLIADNGSNSVISLKEVVVNPAPTPTPVPGTPKIDVFTAAPSEVNLGSDEANNIQLAWSVSGDVTGIELSGESLGKITGLEKQGSRTVSVGDRDTQFVLTAINQTLSASQTVQIKVKVPVPAISSLNPTSKYVGEAGFTLTVNGANFVNGSTLRWNGIDRPTTFVSNTQLTASIPASDIAKAGAAQVTVFNPADSGGGASGVVNFAINNPQPTLTSVTPITVIAGSSDLPIVLSGTGFSADSKVRWNGVDIATTYNSGNTLTAIVPTANMASATISTITVFNPQPFGGSSGPLTFTVANPVPSVASLGPPSSVNVGGQAFELTILGSGFVGGSKGSQISWNGDLRSAIYDSASQLRITIPASDIAIPGLVDVAVVNPEPGGGVSNALQFVIPKNKSSVTLSSSPGSGVAVTGQSVTLTAQVGVQSGVTLVPTGSIRFAYGTSSVTVPLSGNPATASATIALPAGTASITAQYDGDNYFESSTSTALNYAVAEAGVVISLSSVTPSTYGEAVTFNATATAANPGSDAAGRPTGGTVFFFLDGSATPLGSATLTNGTASLTTAITTLLAGNHTITASYDGTADANFGSGTTASPYTHAVNERTPVVSVSTTGSSTYGQTVTITATVSSGVSGLPAPANGANVDFYVDGAFLATATLNNGTASTTTTATYMAGGTRTVSATYNGGSDPNFLNASAANTHTVNKATTSGFITISGPTTVTTTGSQTYTVTITSNTGAIPVGAGVVFKYETHYPSGSGTGAPYTYSETHYPAALNASGQTTDSFYFVVNDQDSLVTVTFAGNSNFLGGSASLVVDGPP